MVRIDTGELRKAANQLDREAAGCSSRESELERCARWIQNQEFGEKETLYRVLKSQCEELFRQSSQFRQLSKAAMDICDRYEATERMLTDYRPFGQKIAQVNLIDLKPVRHELEALGMQMEDL